ncbi:MAG: response regulator [Magnetococcales bacterium]|nr:response regulator [Magnetococcales bacterium]
METEQRHFDVLNRINTTILDIQELLFKPLSPETTKALIVSLGDLKDDITCLGHSFLSEIFQELMEIYSLVLEGRIHQTDIAKETTFLAVDIAFRQLVNLESCDDEVSNLRELVYGIKLGDTYGFKVTNKEFLTQQEDKITLFEDSNNSPVPQRPLKMLVVDDEAPNRMLLKAILDPFGMVDVAYNGEEAIEAFELQLVDQDPYDAVFLDIMMPILDGHQTLAKIRKIEREMGIRPNEEAAVLMVSALDSPKDVCNAFFKGFCTDYIKKPITKNLIVNAMVKCNLIQ